MSKAKIILLTFFVFIGASLSFTACSGCSREEEITTGGWTKESDGTITKEHLELFDKAIKDIEGVSYTPVKLLETQIVAGRNYRFLCDERSSDPDDKGRRVIVTIYESLDGTAEITSVVDE